MIIEYKKGIEIYTDNNGRFLETQKVYNVYHVDQSNNSILKNGKIGFISKCDVLKEWFFFKNQNSDYFVSGITTDSAEGAQVIIPFLGVLFIIAIISIILVIVKRRK